MISQTAEYALRAVVFLAQHSPATTAQIASGTQVPVDYLSKVMQSLSRTGLVRSQRGLHGGFTLTRQSGELTVLDIVSAVDPIRRIPRCPLGQVAHGEQLCPLHRQLDNAAALVEGVFRSTTIAEMLTSSPEQPSCHFPPLPVIPSRPESICPAL